MYVSSDDERSNLQLATATLNTNGTRYQVHDQSKRYNPQVQKLHQTKTRIGAEPEGSTVKRFEFILDATTARAPVRRKRTWASLNQIKVEMYHHHGFTGAQPCEPLVTACARASTVSDSYSLNYSCSLCAECPSVSPDRGQRGTQRQSAEPLSRSAEGASAEMNCRWPPHSRVAPRPACCWVVKRESRRRYTAACRGGPNTCRLPAVPSTPMAVTLHGSVP